ncbi:hypothetical protein QTP86_023760 [Hemibagrus guttatus]|nr:hypothetical protein QTP86_023760 [Hemibagrus guttatus]
MVVCRMTLMVCKKKRSKIEKKTKWWKLKKEECCEEFRQNLRQALGGQVVLPDDWETTAEVIRETGRKVLGVSSGRRKEDKRRLGGGMRKFRIVSRGRDLEKAFDRVPREELWYCMRKSGVAEKYVRVVQDMYERSRTVVRCAVGQTEESKVEVGLHQGSALSPFLFAIVMDQLSEEVRQESPWTMMSADDIVICSESREQVEENLERWRDGIGQVMSGAWFPPDMTLAIQANEFNLCFLRLENFVSHGLRVLQVRFGKLQVGSHVPFTEEWLPSGHSTIQA